MGNQVATGLSATRSANTSPDLTFVWDVVEQGANLQVKVNYGGGTDIDNLGTATIPVGSTTPVKMTPAQNSAMSVNGTVSAVWGDTNNSYVVSFTGQMVRVNMNNIISSNLNGAPSDAYPIIVFANLS